MLFTTAFTSWAYAIELSGEATLYKNPQCLCCDEYVRQLEQAGMSVTIETTTDLAAVMKQAGIPEALAACHTLIVGDYIIEGLVPLNVVERLMTEKPAIRGISLPGMPMGAPGMGTPDMKDGPLTIYEISPDASKVYATD
jgi:hypothetical protein